MQSSVLNSSLFMKTKNIAAKAAPTPSTKISAQAPAKPAVTPQTAPKPTPMATASVAPASGTVTTIEVKTDVGFGNAVFLRGQGGGLNWEHGVALSCVDGKTWRWSGTVKEPVTFKPLINDKIWSAGNDLTVKPGQRLEVKPNFS